jgi:hypothetical protein
MGRDESPLVSDGKGGQSKFPIEALIRISSSTRLNQSFFVDITAQMRERNASMACC